MKEIKPLMVIMILCVASMMAFLAVVGPIIRRLNMQEWHAGLMVALAGVAWVFLSRFWGKKSDVYGRKNILLIAISGFFISYLILAIFINYAVITPPLVIISFLVIMATRVSIGVFYSAIPPVSNALIADKVDSQKRASYMASLGAATGLGMVLGPMIGGALAVYGLAIPLYASAILPLISVFIVILFLEKDIKINKTKEAPLHFFDKRLRLPMIAAFITMFSIVSLQVCLGFFILDKFQMSDVETAKTTGYILSMIGVTFITSQIIVSKLKAVKPITWLTLGATLSAIGYLSIGVISTKIELTIMLCTGTMGLGMIMPAFSAITANSVEAKEQGVAAGTVSSTQGLGIILGPLLSTILYGISPEFPFLFAGATFVILVMISLWYRKRGEI